MKEITVRLHQLNPVIGDVDGNSEKIISALTTAAEASINLLIVPELAVCGYSPMDLLERPAFLKAIEQANERIIAAAGKTALIFGTVTVNNMRQGRPCFNSAIMAGQGRKVAEIHKSLLPTYDVFDEDRYFEASNTFECVEWNDRKLGITICEDIWGNQSSVQYHTYPAEPAKMLVEKGAEAIINISASPFTIEKSQNREQMLKKRAKSTGCPVFYVNQVGANTDLISDGDSMAVSPAGKIIARAPLFNEAFIDVQWQSKNGLKPKGGPAVSSPPGRMARIFEALQIGLKQYLEKTGVTSKVVLGLSGGIDSSLVACIAAAALGPEKVTGVAMPSEFSSGSSVSDAQKLADNLQISLHRLPIPSLYDEYLNVLAPLFKDTEFGIAEENLQSRARGMLLMAIANKFNRFLLNTGNKSELATGYCTLYGDMNGAMAIISDLYKTEVYQLAQWLNDSYYEDEIIPQEVLQKPPSAELRPGQKDTDRLPAYDKLDTILKLYIEERKSAREIERCGIDRETADRVIALIKQSEHKRSQAPPGLKLHQKAFGRGHRWPLVQRWR